MPKSFQLGGHKFKVKKKKHLDNETQLGLCQYYDNEIHIRTENNGKPLSQSVQEHTLLHEITHAILITMNEYELNQNEQFVDTFAGHLHQVLDSTRY